MKKCFIWHGPWTYVRVQHYEDTSFRDPGAESYKAHRRCNTCGIVKVESNFLGGYPTLDQLNGVVNVYKEV